jgi:hypothetical protein
LSSWYETRRYARPQEGLSRLIRSFSLKSNKAYAHQSMSTLLPKTDEPKFGAPHFGHFMSGTKARVRIILIMTLWPGEKHVSQSVLKSTSRLVIASWITNSPFSIFWAPLPCFLKLTFKTATKAFRNQDLIEFRIFLTYLCRSNELEMKRAVSS